MALAMVAPAEVEYGENIVVTASGVTASGGVTLKASAEEGMGGLEFTVTGAADSGGAFTTAGLIDFLANIDGHVDFVLTDVTAATEVTARTKVTMVD